MKRISIVNNFATTALTAVGLAICLGLSAQAQNQGLPSKGDPLNKLVTTGNSVNGVPSECDGVSGNLLANCGFETGDLTGWTQSGDTSFTDVCGPSSLTCTSDVAHTGGFGLRWGPVDSVGLGCISQMVPTDPTALYHLTFQLRDLLVLADPSNRPNNFQVFWNGVKVSGDLVNLPDFDYTQYSLPDLATSLTSSTVKLCAYNGPDFFSLDDVVVVQQ